VPSCSFLQILRPANIRPQNRVDLPNASLDCARCVAIAKQRHHVAYDDGHVTGSGNFSAPRGAVLGLRDADGFDEVRYFAFAVPNRQAGYSAPALDEVRVGVPEPASPLLCGLALLGMGAVRRRGIS